MTRSWDAIVQDLRISEREAAACRNRARLIKEVRAVHELTLRHPGKIAELNARIELEEDEERRWLHLIDRLLIEADEQMEVDA